jgi:SAM-dependent methyltransferase
MNMDNAWPFLSDTPVENGVHRLCGPSVFEALYEKARRIERRILTDDEVRQLPDTTGLWNAAEWEIRARSAKRLLHTLDKLDGPLRILEVGCGNGWLANMLHVAGHRVLGIDAFTLELEQAARVFGDGPTWARADLFSSPLPVQAFDVVLFAASFQYFNDPLKTLERTRELLAPDGEIHLMDSILYRSPVEATAATERSRAYYANMGVPEMTEHYCAHQLAPLRSVGTLSILATPSGMDRTLQRFGRKASPFTHVVIRP